MKGERGAWGVQTDPVPEKPTLKNHGLIRVQLSKH